MADLHPWELPPEEQAALLNVIDRLEARHGLPFLKIHARNIDHAFDRDFRLMRTAQKYRWQKLCLWRNAPPVQYPVLMRGEYQGSRSSFGPTVDSPHE